MEESPSVALRLANTIENLEVVGAVLAGIADATGLDALERSDIQTAALEACKNVVWHAYEGVQGPLELEVGFSVGVVEVTVRDHGIGIRPHLGERTLPHTGIGMPIVHLLARRITYTNIEGGGTEVRMEFSTPVVRAPEARVAPAALELIGQDDSEAAINLALAGRLIVRASLPPVLVALASRAGLEPEGTAEMRRLAEALGDAAEADEGIEEMTLQAGVTPTGVDVRFGPLGERLERTLRASAVPDPGDGALVLVEGVGRGLTLRLCSPR